MIQVEQEQKPIITSPLWTDLYKITMGQAVFHNYPDMGAYYEFINRGRHQFPEGFGRKLQEQIEMMVDISLSQSDREFLERKTPFLTKDYLDFFSNYRYNPEEVYVEQTGADLDIKIEGPWKRTIYWEVPLMALVCELFYQETNQHPEPDYIDRAREKGRMMREANAFFFEFGTRRAFSHEVHRNVIEVLVESAGLPQAGGVLLGTSNVALAKEFDLNPGGTYAHEWVMGHAALFGYSNANRRAMEVWADEYLGRSGGEVYPKLGTSLMDTFTTDVYLRELTAELASYFTYFRQDSGDPVTEGDKAIRRLEELGLDLKTKGVLPSNDLDIPTAISLSKYFRTRTQETAGIGTNLTNDAGPKPMNHVIKAHAFTKEGLWVPVCKLSDDRGKESGDLEAIQKAKEEFGLV